jgi:hypothetical protein
MKRISPLQIYEINDIVMELPPFRDLNSREQMHEILNEFFTQLYIDTPEELFNAFGYSLNCKMQETFFINYGIDERYYKRIGGYFKEQLAFNLERLFQAKGSNIIFKFFAQIFERVLRSINFYNIEVHKVPAQNGFKLEYKLKPIYLSDPEGVIEYPEQSITKQRKYLMDLHNFKDYTTWPVPTNLIYIQFTLGIESINNFDTFINGIRSFAVTYLQPAVLKYMTEDKEVEYISGGDIELLYNYFKIKLLRIKEPDWNFRVPLPVMYSDYQGSIEIDSYLQFNEGNYAGNDERIEFLDNIESMLNEYQDMKIGDYDAFEHFKRRWQMFLKQQPVEINYFDDADELVQKVEERYPIIANIVNKFIVEEDHNHLYSFLIEIYSLFLNSAQNIQYQDRLYNHDWVTRYVDIIFNEIFLADDFIVYVFNPILDLFMRYFFPVEIEFIKDLLNKIKIKDKMNTVPLKSAINEFKIIKNHFDYDILTEKPDRTSTWIKRPNIRSMMNLYDRFGKYITITPPKDNQILHDDRYGTNFNINKFSIVPNRLDEVVITDL